MWPISREAPRAAGEAVAHAEIVVVPTVDQPLHAAELPALPFVAAWLLPTLFFCTGYLLMSEPRRLGAYVL